MTSHLDVHVQVNVYLNLPNTDINCAAVLTQSIIVVSSLSALLVGTWLTSRHILELSILDGMSKQLSLYDNGICVLIKEEEIKVSL